MRVEGNRLWREAILDGPMTETPVGPSTPRVQSTSRCYHSTVEKINKLSSACYLTVNNIYKASYCYLLSTYLQAGPATTLITSWWPRWCIAAGASLGAVSPWPSRPSSPAPQDHTPPHEEQHRKCRPAEWHATWIIVLLSRPDNNVKIIKSNELLRR